MTKTPQTPGGQANHQPYIKISFFFKKRSDLTYEQFYHHWEIVHASLTVATKCHTDLGILRCVQFQPRPEYIDLVKQMEEASQGRMVTMTQFDGCTELYVKTWEDWLRFAGSDEYTQAIGPDAANFIEGPVHVIAGIDNLMIGRAVEGLNGKDGIV